MSLDNASNHLMIRVATIDNLMFNKFLQVIQ